MPQTKSEKIEALVPRFLKDGWFWDAVDPLTLEIDLSLRNGVKPESFVELIVFLSKGFEKALVLQFDFRTSLRRYRRISGTKFPHCFWVIFAHAVIFHFTELSS